MHKIILVERTFSMRQRRKTKQKKRKLVENTWGVFSRKFHVKAFCACFTCPFYTTTSFFFNKAPLLWKNEKNWKKLRPQDCKFIPNGNGDWSVRERVCLDFLPNFVSLRIY